MLSSLGGACKACPVLDTGAMVIPVKACSDLAEELAPYPGTRRESIFTRHRIVLLRGAASNHMRKYHLCQLLSLPLCGQNERQSPYKRLRFRVFDEVSEPYSTLAIGMTLNVHRAYISLQTVKQEEHSTSLCRQEERNAPRTSVFELGESRTGSLLAAASAGGFDTADREAPARALVHELHRSAVQGRKRLRVHHHANAGGIHHLVVIFDLLIEAHPKVLLAAAAFALHENAQLRLGHVVVRHEPLQLRRSRLRNRNHVIALFLPTSRSRLNRKLPFANLPVCTIRLSSTLYTKEEKMA